MSLRARISLLVGVVTVALATIATVVVVRENWQRSERAIDDELITELDLQDRLLAQQFDGGLELRLAEPSRGGVAVFDQFGDLVDRRGAMTAEQAEAITIEFEASSLSEFDLFIDDSIETGLTAGVTGCIEPLACGWIVAARSQTSFFDYLASRLAWLLIVVGVATGITVVAARFLVASALRPVDRMRGELDEITAHDLARRVPVPRTGDELETLGMSLNGTIERLEVGVEAQRRFAADAAHELRSPLAGLRATLEVAARRPDTVSDSIDRAIGEVDRATTLVDDLLVLARSDGHSEGPAMRLCDIDDIVRSAVASVRAAHPGIAFDREGIEPVQAHALPDAIARVARNLVANAAMHATSSVAIRLAGREAEWVLIVDDDGRGVPPADRQRVFERFVRLDDSRSRDTGGSGLGLAIVRELVAAHGGSVVVGDSKLDGARFEVRTPRTPR